MNGFSIDLNETLENLGFKRTRNSFRPRSSGNHSITTWQAPGYTFMVCPSLKKYYISTDKGSLEEISYDSGYNILTMSKNLEKIYESDYFSIYCDSEESSSSKASDPEYRSKRYTYLTMEEVGEVLFLKEFLKRIRRNPLISFLYSVWYSSVGSWIKENLSLTHEVLGLIPNQDGLQKTSLKDIKTILKCSLCKSTFIVHDLAAFSKTKEQCEICSAGNWDGERAINKFIRYQFIPWYSEMLIDYKRQYELPGGQKADFYLEVKNKKTGKLRAMILEFDGKYHNEPKTVEDDLKRHQICKKLGIEVVRFRPRIVSKERKKLYYDEYSPYSDSVKEIDNSSILIDFEDNLGCLFLNSSYKKFGIPNFKKTIETDKKNLLKKIGVI